MEYLYKFILSLILFTLSLILFHIFSHFYLGGILVFVTGQLEVNQLCSKLNSSFPKPSSVESLLL